MRVSERYSHDKESQSIQKDFFGKILEVNLSVSSWIKYQDN